MDQMLIEKLVANYKPNNAAVDQLSKINLLMTLGPSGVGKSTLMQASGIPLVVGDASRLARSDERQGRDYYFRSLDDMLVDIQNGEYIQVAIGSENDLKGTKATSFPESGPATFAVTSTAIGLFRSLPFASTTTAVIVPPSYEIWMARLGEHQLGPEQLKPRIAEAQKSLNFALTDKQSYFVLNDNVENGVKQLKQVAAGQKPDQDDATKAIAQQLLEKLNQSLGA